MTNKARGFAAMSPERLAEVSRKGGKTGNPKTKGFAKMTPEKRAELSRKGGLAAVKAQGGGKAVSEKLRKAREAKEAERLKEYREVLSEMEK